MKPKIHPKYYPEATVTCACGNSWVTGSTVEEIKTDICSNCHPFYTGKLLRIVDTAGQVERFTKRVERAQEMQQQAEKRTKARTERERSRRLVELVSDEEAVEPIEGVAEVAGEDSAEAATDQE